MCVLLDQPFVSAWRKPGAFLKCANLHCRRACRHAAQQLWSLLHFESLERVGLTGAHRASLPVEGILQLDSCDCTFWCVVSVSCRGTPMCVQSKHTASSFLRYPDRCSDWCEVRVIRTAAVCPVAAASFESSVCFTLGQQDLTYPAQHVRGGAFGVAVCWADSQHAVHMRALYTHRGASCC